jgi:hypothetical protein
MHVTRAQCWTCPTTTATTSMYRGYRRMNAMHARIKTRWVGPILPMCYFAITPLARADALGFVDCASSGSPLQISTEIGSASSTTQHKTSVQAGRDDARNPQDSSFRTDLSESQTLYDSPMDVVRCDGWCGYDIIPHATVVCVICAWRTKDKHQWSDLLAAVSICVR